MPDPFLPRITPLPVVAPAPVTTCAGCGVCCTEQTVPPFLDEIDFIPRELELQVREAERSGRGEPCLWYDPQIKGCRHYEHRPNVCREFETGSECCLEIRARFGV